MAVRKIAITLPGWGEDFARELDRLFGRLATFPNSAPLVSGYEPVRRARLRRFPCQVFYGPGDDAVAVLRVVHIARSPGTWRT